MLWWTAVLRASSLRCRGVLALVGVVACRASIDEMSEVYYRGPGPRVLCATSIDTRKADTASIRRGLERARRDGTIVQLYAHGTEVTPDRIETILETARARGLATFTYSQLADGIPASAGLALSFDDHTIDAWYELAGVFARYDARVTFFVSRYPYATAEQRAKLQELHRLGHDIQSHSVDHPHAPRATAAGVQRYAAEQVAASLAALRADGFTPRVYAYPYGERFEALDRAVLDHVELVRTTAYAIDRYGDDCW